MTGRPQKDEWYTPKELIEKITACYTGKKIDLDPASSKIANDTVKAKTYFNSEQNGLFKSWEGYDNVFLNPPYSEIGVWVRKIANEFKQPKSPKEMVVICPVRSESPWFQEILQIKSLQFVFFKKGRCPFSDPNGVIHKKPPFSTCIFVFGSKSLGEKFTQAFKNEGSFVKPYKN
jgi:phage N-6-adenine-methyltransferase